MRHEQRSRTRSQNFLARSRRSYCRIAADLPLPYRTATISRMPHSSTAGLWLMPHSIVDATDRLNAAAAVIGPVTVSALFDQLFAIDDQRRPWAAMINMISRCVLTARSQHGKMFSYRYCWRGLRQQSAAYRLDGRSARASWRRRWKFEAANRPPASCDPKRHHRCMDCDVASVPNTVRHASSEVARAAERLADASLTEPLRLLLERDLTDHAAARAAYLG